MAKKDILLELKTKLGAGGLTDLKSGLDMMVAFKNKVQETIKEFDRFAEVMSRVDMSVINYADSAAQGQVDTFELMKAMQRLQKSGTKITEEQFKILAVRATDMAKATGQDATEAFKRLTEGISRGTTRALADYGIRLKTSTDLHKTQADAVRLMTEGYEDLEVELETTSNRLSQLDNNWGTFKASVWSLTDSLPGVSSGLNKINDVLGETNKAITETPKAIHSWLTEWENVASVMNIGLQGLRGNINLVALEFRGLVETIANDPMLKKAVELELHQKKMAQFDDQYWAERMGVGSHMGGADVWAKKGKTGGGGAGSGVDIGIGLSPQAQRWSETLGVEVTPETIGWFESFAARMGGDLSMGMEGAPTARRQGQGFGEADWEAASSSVDEKMAELIDLDERRARVSQDAVDSIREYMAYRDEEVLSMQELQISHENRLMLLQDEEYQEARLVEMRQSEQIYEAEREIYMAYEREKAIQFAHEFANAWKNSYRTVSAGASAVGHMQDLLKAAWASLVTSVIRGSKDWKDALREVLISKGISIAIEEGWLGLQDLWAAASAFARRQYAKGTSLLASAAGHASLAGIAGAASGVASRLGGSGGGAGAGGGAESYSSPTPTFSGGGGYGGNEGPSEVTYVIKLDDGAPSEMFRLVRQGNDMERRAGGTSFVDDDEQAA